MNYVSIYKGKFFEFPYFQEFSTIQGSRVPEKINEEKKMEDNSLVSVGETPSHTNVFQSSAQAIFMNGLVSSSETISINRRCI